MPCKIQKEDAEFLLKELAVQFRKINGRNADIEMVIVGGGSILLNYNFRGMTEDFDVASTANRELKEASIAIRDKYDLEYNWINSDFLLTNSNSALLRQYSVPYKSFNNGHFVIRTIKAEFLIAMKMLACRDYKNDRSDIVGVLKEEKQRGNPISFTKVCSAISNLYGSTEKIRNDILTQVEQWCSLTELELGTLYNEIRNDEESIAVAIKDKIDHDDKGVFVAMIDDLVDLIKKDILNERAAEP